jgi:branched-chain amino acid aminotransferase
MAYCYFNGAVIPFEDARVRPDDLGMLRGFAVYEGITAVQGKMFHYSDHWDRLVVSSSALGLIIPYSKVEVEQGLTALLAKDAPHGRASIRLILSGGAALGGLEYVPGNTLLYALAESAAACPSEWYTEGASLITSEHERFMPEFKTTSYITAVMLQSKRKEAGAAEVLYTANGLVFECATSNIFIVKDGVASTPSEAILKGITRKVAVELLTSASMHPVEERSVTLQELMDADEVFMTSSFKDIVPIVIIDGTTVGGGTPGPVTKSLMKKYQDELVRAV